MSRSLRSRHGTQRSSPQHYPSRCRIPAARWCRAQATNGPDVSVPAVPQPGALRLAAIPTQRIEQKTQEPVTLATLNDIRTMFQSLLSEYEYWVDESWVTGTIPPELCGTYYRNGPGLHVTNPRYSRHTLDGDGMVLSIAFKDGKAFFRNRFVRTKGFLAEQAAGRPLFRNSFTPGTAEGGPVLNPFELMDFKNTANTGVLPWAGQLYALWEAGLPHLMDPVSLDTLSESRMGGQITTNTFAAHYRILDEGVEVDGEQREHRQQQQPRPVGYRQDEGMSLGEMWMRHHAHAHTHAHPEVRPGPQPHSHVASTQHTYPGAATPLGHFGHQQQQHHQQGQAQQQQEFRRHHRDGSGRQRLVTFSNEFSFTGARAVFYEFDEDGRLLHRQEHMLEGVDIAVIHDMVVTEHHYVLLVGPINLQPVKFGTQYVMGRCSIAECLAFDPTHPTRIMLFPRPGRPSGKVFPTRVLEAPPMFVFHNVNGWEVALAEGQSAEDLYRSDLQQQHVGASVGAEEGGEAPEPTHLVIDTVAWDEVSFELEIFDRENHNLDNFVGGARAQLTRLVCDLRTGRVTRTKLVQRTLEFPTADRRVTGRPQRVSWFIADGVDDPVLWGPPNSLIRVEVDPWVGFPTDAAAASQGQNSQHAYAATAQKPGVQHVVAAHQQQGQGQLARPQGLAGMATMLVAAAAGELAGSGGRSLVNTLVSHFVQPGGVGQQRAGSSAWHAGVASSGPASAWGFGQHAQEHPHIAAQRLPIDLPLDGSSHQSVHSPSAGASSPWPRKVRRQQLQPPRRSPSAVRYGTPTGSGKVAVDVWPLGDRTFPGEPMFVPRPGSDREGDGWIILAVHDAATEQAAVHIFDAEDIAAGPVATMHLPHRLPFSLHGAWSDTYTGPDPWDTSVPKWQVLGRAKPL